MVGKPSVIDRPPEVRRPRAFRSNARGRSTFTVDSAFSDDADGRDAIAIRLDPRILGRLLGLGPRGILQRAVDILPQRPVLVFRMAGSLMISPINQLQRVGHLFFSLETYNGEQP